MHKSLDYIFVFWLSIQVSSINFLLKNTLFLYLCLLLLFIILLLFTLLWYFVKLIQLIIKRILSFHNVFTQIITIFDTIFWWIKKLLSVSLEQNLIFLILLFNSIKSQLNTHLLYQTKKLLINWLRLWMNSPVPVYKILTGLKLLLDA